MELKYTRKCPKCGDERFYTRKDNLKRDEKKNLLCRSCCRIGNKFSDEHRKKLSDCKIGTKQSMVNRLKNSIINKQRFLNDPTLRKKSSETSKRVLNLPDVRKKHIQSLQETRWLGQTFDKGQLELLKKWNKVGFNFEPNYQLHTDDFLCYIDGYDKEKNVVIEYDGKYHNTISQKEKDLVRQNKIIKILKPNKFWRYDSVNKQFRNVLEKE